MTPLNLKKRKEKKVNKFKKKNHVKTQPAMFSGKKNPGHTTHKTLIKTHNVPQVMLSHKFKGPVCNIQRHEDET